MRPINLQEKLTKIDAPWSPRVVAELNDYQLKLVRLEGEFVWHQHDDTDEAFYVLSGRLRIELRGDAVEMGPGDLYVVPKGVEHRPVALPVCEALLIEPRGVVNTGDAGGALTAENDRWV
ncbi:MAG: cupin domain-containing protein [Myxococcales bacterium]|nr:cupin domain-containing protein [Myxococcales bacterium]MCB9651978.1 cupin domain-containing protein [Deltaproteobacteria bacterium]